MGDISKGVANTLQLSLTKKEFICTMFSALLLRDLTFCLMWANVQSNVEKQMPQAANCPPAYANSSLYIL
jgi:hypothetical protein